MKIHKTPQRIWEEYRKGTDYKRAIDLYSTVEENENFYIGRQWEGVNAPDLQKPVINILKRAVAHRVSTICSEDVGIDIRPFHETEETVATMRAVSREVERVMEQDGTKSKFRSSVRNAEVDGDGCLYFYFDPNVKTGQAAEGEIRSEIIENINVIFGNPHELDVQKQPYIIIAQRKPVDEVIDEAKANGKPTDSIIADRDENQGEKGDGNELCTVLTKLWREKDKIRAIKATENALVRGEWTPGNERYPISWMRIENIRKCYHGEATITGLIPNQISINKLFAMYARSVEMLAFPKVVYDKTKFGKRGWTNRVGEAIGINGDVTQAAVNVMRGGDVSAQVMEVIQTCITLTKDSIGASDAALGNISPEQASGAAIVATQRASEAPLEIQRRQFFDFAEDSVRIILDLMCAHYGTRQIKHENTVVDPITGAEKEENTMEAVNFDILRDEIQHIDVRVGSSAYWSEIMQMQTMDNLLRNGIIQDTALFIESIPDKWLPEKQKILDSVRQAQEQMNGMPMEGQPVGQPDIAAQFNEMLA